MSTSRSRYAAALLIVSGLGLLDVFVKLYSFCDWLIMETIIILNGPTYGLRSKKNSELGIPFKLICYY